VGREGKIFAIALDPNEEFLVVGGFLRQGHGIGDNQVGNIRIYNYQSGRLVKVLKSHNDVVYDLAFSKDGKYLISGSGDGTAKIWSVENFTLIDTITTHSNDVFGVKIIKKADEYFAITAGFYKIVLYSLKRKKVIVSYSFLYESTFLAINSVNKEIAVCGRSSRIHIYDFDFKLKQTIKTESMPSGLNYSKDGRYLIAGTANYPNNVNIYNTFNYQKIQTFKNHTNLVMAVNFLDNQKAISAGGTNNEIVIWDIVTAKVFKKIEGKGRTVWKVGIHKDNVAWGNKLNYQNHNNIEKVQKLISLKNFQIQSTIKKPFKGIPLVNNIWNLAVTKEGYYNFSDGVLLVKKNGKVEAKIKRYAYNGLKHRCYGWYDDFIISGGSNGNLKVYNKKGREIANLVGHIGDILSLALDGDILISGSSDQTIRVWDLSQLKIDNAKLKINYEFLRSQQNILKKQGKNYSFEKIIKRADSLGINYYLTQQIKPQLNLFISKNNDWIAWTPEGYFNASRKGDGYLYFHLNQGADKEAKAIPMKSLYDHFNRPDLIKLKLAGEEEVYKKAINDITYKTALKDPPPTVTIKDIDKKTKKDKIKLSFNIKDNNGGIGLIRIYQEGKLIQIIGKGQVKKQSANRDVVEEQTKLNEKNEKNQKDERLKELLTSLGGEVEIDETLKKEEIETISNEAKDYEIEVDLIAGKNEIGIEAFNKTNTVTSYRETVVIEADIPKKEPKLYAIVAGVNNFEHVPKKYHLNYAEDDAKAIKNEIENNIGKLFDEVEIKYLTDKNMTKINILKAIKEIKKKAKLEDTIIFFLSTHGEVSKKGKLYFLPYNNKQVTNHINFEETFNAIQSLKALNQIFIIDACKSGKANDIVSAVYDSRASVLARSAGVHMLLATTRGASAFEPKKGESNVLTFTQRVLKTMREKSTDKNSDGFVSVVELSKALQEPQNIVEYQYPVIRNVGGDVRLGKVQ